MKIGSSEKSGILYRSRRNFDDSGERHILNLLEEVEGKLPQDKQRMLGVSDRYLGLSDEDRLLFQLGRRGELSDTWTT